MTRLLVVSSIGVSLIVSTPANAQLCSGEASFAQRPWHLSTAVAFSKKTSSVNAGLGFGGSGPFGQLIIAITNYDPFDGSQSADLGLRAGWQIAVDPKGVFQFCPLASWVHAFGPDSVSVGTQLVNFSQDVVTVGAGLGAVMLRKSKTQIVPSVSVAGVKGKRKSTDTVSGQSATNSETLGLVELGVGFLFTSRGVSLRPDMGLTFGVRESPTTYGGLSVSLNFGRRGTSP